MNLKRNTTILLAATITTTPVLAKPVLEFFISDLEGQYRSLVVTDNNAHAVIRTKLTKDLIQECYPDSGLTKGWANLQTSANFHDLDNAETLSDRLNALTANCDNVEANTTLEDLSAVSPAPYRRAYSGNFMIDNVIDKKNTDVITFKILRKNMKYDIGTKTQNNKEKPVWKRTNYSALYGVSENPATSDIQMVPAKDPYLYPAGLGTHLKGDFKWVWNTKATFVSDDGHVILGYQMLKYPVDFQKTNADDVYMVDNTLVDGTTIPVFWTTFVPNNGQCNGDCNATTAHAGVSKGYRLANGTYRSDIKATKNDNLVNLEIDDTLQDNLKASEVMNSFQHYEIEEKYQVLTRVNGIYHHDNAYYIFGQSHGGYAAFVRLTFE
ncbi:hypothetical protein JCM19235_6281 [Vibrio maritimus]|uniref:Uncharacterized protein n=1 Tax=Vibrio maritimus TaxID=990268 RepID=A0A090RT31_9VIBR|nr:hypothetical protein JCM19235_6281 [Vibrio maritimus]